MKTKKKTTPATPAPIDQRPTCCRCGGHNVETQAWIEYRPDGTTAVVNGEGPDDTEYGNWCHDCDDHGDLDYPETTPADHARTQAAEAAREAGPELLAALRLLIDAAVSVYDGQSSEFPGLVVATEKACDAIAKAGG